MALAMVGPGALSANAASAASRTYSEASSRVTYGGRWIRGYHADYSGGQVRFANQAGASATFSFSGTAVSWIGPVGPTRGMAKVYLDGRLVRTVNTYAARFRTGRVLFSANVAAGSHKLSIVAVGTKGHPTVAIDGFVVLNDPSSPKPPSTTYAAVFGGDATGETDVTAALKAFLQAHDGQRVALVPNGTYKVTSVAFHANDLTLDFRGARIVGSRAGAAGILRLATGKNVVLNDPTVVGTGYEWDDDLQAEHGIWIDGGSNIQINNAVISDTRGDGIYIGYRSGSNQPATDVVIRNPDIQRASRNGIAPVAGQVTIIGGHINRVGLHGIDFEVNDDTGAASIVGVVTGVDIRNQGDLPEIDIGPYAVAAGGYSSATKPSLVIENLTGDRLRMTIRNTANVIVRNNVSDTDTTADFRGSGSITFTGNTRIARE